MGNILFDHSQNVKKRPRAHVIGERAVGFIKEVLPQYWVCRECNPDYGLDLEVELFSENGTLGEHVYLQVKGVESANVKKIKVNGRLNVEISDVSTDDKYEIDVIQYQVDTGLLATVEEMGSSVPVLLSVVDLAQRKAYLVCLNDYIEKLIIPRCYDYQEQKSIVINIPVENVLDVNHGQEIIEWYGKRAKLYTFFNKVNYQKNELGHCVCVKQKVALAKRFACILGRLDAWSAGKYWAGLKIYQEELMYLYENGITKIGSSMLQADKKAGRNVLTPEWEGTWCVGNVSLEEIHTVQGIHTLWQELDSLSHTFEDVVKEWYLPTSFMQVIKNA